MAKLSSTVIYGDLQVDGEIKNKATTETEGVVLLSDEVNNTSTSQGATANSVKKVNDSLSSHKTDTTSHITASERNTWNGKANASHTHTKSQITDFPTSLPANGGNADTVKGRDICTEVDSLKSSVSNGKQEIATAITGKGVSALGSDTFTQLSTKISSIPIGVDTSDATAMSSNILAGKTAYVKGQKVTGVMTYRGASPLTLTYPGEVYTIPEGYHSGIQKITCSSYLYSYSTVNYRLANLFYYTLHYAFDSWLIMQNPSFSTELLDGAMQSGSVKRVGFSAPTTLYLEGYQPLFIYGGGKVSSHGGVLNDECGNGSSYVGYFFDDIDEEYVVNLTNNGSTCYYYILSI